MLLYGTSRAQGLGLEQPLLLEPGELVERLVPVLSGCPTALRAAQGAFRLIDARTAEAFAESHALTAVNLPFAAVTTERDGVGGLLADLATVEGLLTDLGVDMARETVLYSDRGNLWASRLFWILDYFGHPNIRLLDGGFARFSQEPTMVTTETAAVEPTAGGFRAQPDPGKIVDTAWVETNLGNPEVVFVDAREQAGFDEGHLPGAISLPWNGNLAEDETFLPRGQLFGRFLGAGVRPDKTVVNYCQLGVLSAHNYFVQRHLDYPDIRLYDGSWADWSKDPDRPVEQS